MIKELCLAALIGLSTPAYTKQASSNQLESKVAQEESVTHSNSLPVLYEAAKTASEEELFALHQKFKKSFKADGLVKYGANAEIKSGKEKSSVEVPVYFPKGIRSVLSTIEGVRYVQALFGTQDSAIAMLKGIQRLTGYDENDIAFWTLSSNERKKQQYAVITISNDDMIHIHATTSPKEYERYLRRAKRK